MVWPVTDVALAKPIEQPFLAPITTGTLRQLPLARPAYNHSVLQFEAVVIRL